MKGKIWCGLKWKFSFSAIFAILVEEGMRVMGWAKPCIASSSHDHWCQSIHNVHYGKEPKAPHIPISCPSKCTPKLTPGAFYSKCCSGFVLVCMIGSRSWSSVHSHSLVITNHIRPIKEKEQWVTGQLPNEVKVKEYWVALDISICWC